MKVETTYTCEWCGKVFTGSGTEAEKEAREHEQKCPVSLEGRIMEVFQHTNSNELDVTVRVVNSPTAFKIVDACKVFLMGKEEYEHWHRAAGLLQGVLNEGLWAGTTSSAVLEENIREWLDEIEMKYTNKGED